MGTARLDGGPLIIRCDATGRAIVWFTSPSIALRNAAVNDIELTCKGSLVDGRFFECSGLSSVSWPAEDVPPDSISFRARKVAIGPEYSAGEATFRLTNLLLQTSAVDNPAAIASIDDVTVELAPDEAYEERMRFLRAYKSTEVTASLKLSPRDSLRNVRDLAGDICVVLSAFTGQKVNWIAIESATGILFEGRVTKPCSGWPVIGRLESVFAKDWNWNQLLQNVLGALPTFYRHAELYPLRAGLVDLWIDARISTDFLESRCLKMVVVLEVIKSAFRDHQEIRGDFRSLLEKVCADVRVTIPAADFDLLVKLRNRIVHQGAFLNPSRLSKIEQYELLTRHTDRIILALAGASLDL